MKQKTEQHVASSSISAYRKHYSCQIALLRLLEEFKIAFDIKDHAALVDVDLSKAFDCLPHGLFFIKT